MEQEGTGSPDANKWRMKYSVLRTGGVSCYVAAGVRDSLNGLMPSAWRRCWPAFLPPLARRLGGLTLTPEAFVDGMLAVMTLLLDGAMTGLLVALARLAL